MAAESWKRNRKEMPRLDKAARANIRGKKYRSTIHHEFQRSTDAYLRFPAKSRGERIVARDRVARWSNPKASVVVGYLENLNGGGRSVDRILLIDEY